ncbi:MAG TPA: TetR/AcrR family transcriptional regulator [Rectinemataceae bacterium]|nr:TetR/AcrR family transcriptional regulator [Rectinemataceae bacterium]
MASRTREHPTTEKRLISAAVELFSGKWYGIVSVAEICRRAGLSNGVFYRYFDSKESLFKLLLGQVSDMIRSALDGVQGSDRAQRLRSFTEIIIRFSESHRDLVSVFREGQYRFFEYERRLVSVYSKSLGSVLGREAGMAEYLFALGGLRFCAIRRAFHGAAVHSEAVYGILAQGLFRGMGFDAARVFGGSASALPLPLQESARERLLRAGRKLFGERGFFETNIHEVTDSAGLSVGAFYTYFESKEAFYAELIARVGHDVRAFISSNLASSGTGGMNALELELRGLWLWLVYLSMDIYCYNIVREAEFVLPSAVRGYYDAFAAGYRKRPAELKVNCAARGIDETSAIEYLMGIAHYLGIEAAFDESPANARSLVEAIGGYLAGGFSEYLN